jgi:hypothetical protein
MQVFLERGLRSVCFAKQAIEANARNNRIYFENLR